jgi:cytochrome P450
MNSLGGPGFFGSLRAVSLGKLHLTVEEWAQRFGPLYKFRLGARTVVVVSDPQLVREVMRDRPAGFRKWRQIEEVAREIGAHGVFSAEGDDWKRQRRMVMPVFGTGPARAKWSAFRTIAERLRNRWLAAAGKPLEVQPDMTRFTVDVTAQVVFGRELNTVERGSNELHRDIEEIFGGVSRRSAAPFPYWRYFKLPADRRLARALVRVRAELDQLIRSARGRSGPAETLLEAMVEARDEEDGQRKFSDEEVFGNAMTMLLAGEDTTANTLAWTTYFMARDPEVLSRVRQEADVALGANTTLARLEDAASLRYTGALVREALRLRSPVPIVFQSPVADTELGGIKLAADTPLILLTRAVEMQQTGADAGELRPERWQKDEGKGGLAFGDGPRLCPGRGLALLECAMVLSMMAKSFDLELASQPREHWNFVMQPKDLRVAFRPRAHP